VVHRHQPPLIQRNWVRGISERVDSLGNEVIPLREEDVREAVRDLVALGVDSIVVVYLWSFLDDDHEQRTKKLVLEELNALDVAEIPCFLSSEVSPTLRELPRANATVIEAFSGPSTLRALVRLESDLKAGGFKGDLQVMQSAGGLAPARHVRAIDTAMSGPVGGLVGTRTLGELYGFESLISTDVGGTSFDVGLVSNGFIGIDREPVLAGLLLSLPMMDVHSVGAGGGTISRIDELSGRLVVGPESAGSRPGPVCYGAGGSEPTVTDADLVLGYLNPRGLLNGKISLDVQAAREAIRTKIAEPLGLSLEDAADGIRRVIDAKMRETVTGLVSLRGSQLDDYVLLAFGGAGPGHVCGYTDKLPLKGVLTFPYAAAFSAFGASTADYEHHYSRAVNVVVSPNADDNELISAGARISAAWERLEEQAIDQMALEGFDRGDVVIKPLAMVRYGRQLNDLITNSPVVRCRTADDLRSVIAAFEDLYARVFAKGAQFPQAGYEIFEVGLVASARKVKPGFVRRPLEGDDPCAALYESRPAYWNGEWVPTPRYRWELLRPGNIVQGPVVIEAPTTTLVLPPNRSARIDEYLSVWIGQQ
jgi:N-methylhydantoinase A